MTTETDELTKTQHEFRRRRIAAGEARCAMFRRIYDAAIEDVWDACTNPERLRRWYAPVQGDLRLGGAFTQGDFGSGRITRCEPPRLLTVALGDGDPAPDEIELRLSPGADGTTLLESSTPRPSIPMRSAVRSTTRSTAWVAVTGRGCSAWIGTYAARCRRTSTPRCCTCDRSSGRRSSEAWRSSRSSSKPTSTANDRCARCPDAA